MPGGWLFTPQKKPSCTFFTWGHSIGRKDEGLVMRAPTNIEQLLLLVDVIWAMSLGAVLGFERTRQGKSTGIRTLMLVAGASAFITAIGAWIAEVNEFGDPARTLAAFVQGIGFLGAGAIVRGGDKSVSGLTTAAGILYTAAIGAAVPLGFGIAATGVTLLGIVVLHVVGHAVHRSRYNSYESELEEGSDFGEV